VCDYDCVQYSTKRIQSNKAKVVAMAMEMTTIETLRYIIFI